MGFLEELRDADAVTVAHLKALKAELLAEIAKLIPSVAPPPTVPSPPPEGASGTS